MNWTTFRTTGIHISNNGFGVSLGMFTWDKAPSMDDN